MIRPVQIKRLLITVVMTLMMVGLVLSEPSSFTGSKSVEAARPHVMAGAVVAAQSEIAPGRRHNHPKQ